VVVPRDRRLAAGAFLALALVLVGAVAVASDQARPTRAAHPRAVRSDPAVQARLLHLAAAGERGAWIVRYDVKRVRAGLALSERASEARKGNVHVTRGATSVDVDTGVASYSCTLVDNSVECLDGSTPSKALAPSEVLAVLFRQHAYVVRQAAPRVIAGEKAECFAVLSAGPVFPNIGDRAEYCFGSDGVPLRTELALASGKNERVATSVRRNPSADDMSALVGDAEPPPTTTGR
jgi:hypothetical protein